ncbi:CGNR zinc finger domain-containing protein [Nocardia sp. 2]|uniref:CGNR zinc finger domain-containing protein n=1 Tax=Nocardia acididurans TaxID=2802282 RepID=A0ABS1M9M9_9NOCA|nr:CGNR zinc finger domain-containing protein [Nocardia acididurans]MBL1076740.1 CGNR zinc finger domain-containing protein [Nocardia acididurans]
MFTFVSGNLTLDFIGTVKARRTDFADTLTTPADLSDWFVAAGLLDRAPAVDADTLEQAKTLREATYHLTLSRFDVRQDGAMLPPPNLRQDSTTADVARRAVNRFARVSLPDIDLRPDGTIRRAGTAEQALAEIARTTIELLGTTAARIKECGRDGCTRLYLDTSRAGSRRWCDMTVCGNRSKSAAFRARNA